MERYLKLARRADAAFGIVFLALAVYAAVDASFLMMVVWASSSVISFASVKVMPARWVLSRVLSSRLKQSA